MAPCSSCTRECYPSINVSAFFLLLCASATTFLCRRCHFQSVDGFCPAASAPVPITFVDSPPPTVETEERLMRGGIPPLEWSLHCYTDFLDVESLCYLEAFFFFFFFDPEWTSGDVFLTWAGFKFVWGLFVLSFLSSLLIFLSKWIPMDCVTIWFMQPPRCNEKRLRL